MFISDTVKHLLCYFLYQANTFSRLTFSNLRIWPFFFLVLYNCNLIERIKCYNESFEEITL